MSDFETSPRSSKRRKTTINGSSSPIARTTRSTHSDISRKVVGISRRLFRSGAAKDESAQNNRSTDIRDSAYGSKEDSFLEEDSEGAVDLQLAAAHAGANESADELTQAGVTTTPTGSQRHSQGRKKKAQNIVVKALVAHADVEESEKMSCGPRSSGRERKPPRRFSSSWDNAQKAVLPRGTLTPSKKGNRTPQKSVAFESNGAVVEEDLGFKDFNRTEKNKTLKARRRKGANSNERDQTQVVEDVPLLLESREEDQVLEIPQLEDDLLPDVPELPEIASIPSIESLPTLTDPRLDVAKSVVMSRLTGQVLTPVTGLEAEYTKLHTLLSATINAGEGNSILLLGSRGVGKTCLVETAIADLSIEHAKDFHVVRLNGFFQTDDKLALREIWRQLGREMKVDEDETTQMSTYADTMASLLHLLSHPEELAETLEPDATARTTKSVVFVLDEFDLFTTHPRQTLLYNLFDIAQARKAPTVVIGCSARVDVSDNLEKRVKSRFSHRWIHVPQAKSFSAFEEIVKAALLLREDDKCCERRSIISETRSDWNAFIEKVFLPSPHVRSLLKHFFHTTKSVPDLFSSICIEIAAINSLEQTNLQPSIPSQLQPPDTILEMLPHLPPLHLSLLISSARLDAIHNATIVTFELVYSHYFELVSRARLQASAAGSIAQATKLWNRDVAAAAWEDLAEWEIVLPASGKANEREQTRMWRCDVVLEEIIGAVGGADAGMSDVMIRWCKEI